MPDTWKTDFLAWQSTIHSEQGIALQSITYHRAGQVNVTPGNQANFSGWITCTIDNVQVEQLDNTKLDVGLRKRIDMMVGGQYSQGDVMNRLILHLNLMILSNYLITRIGN